MLFREVRMSSLITSGSRQPRYNRSMAETEAAAFLPFVIYSLD